ncbi:TRAP transporter substrate-binding protein [Nesterenkonia sp. HG001]|uniref:TRAP transporter substrate-binding protein n=1 Tax=Nesterenkonia sp. HG001 TaxID=2983207 RepID=UPI002AC4703D|nr:TRAP transporter substrate-binding protein [Nesterenkonia sp. HG001]MDZ5076604.1 TRAP transporter substrate-binding protein [Nesterenkonia sp. HG001]
MKKSASAMAVLAIVVPLAACGGGDDETTTITLANVWDIDHPMSQAVDEVFAAQVEERSGGALQVDTFHGGTLGSEDELWDSVRNGSIDAAIIGSGMNQEYPTMLISDWPFLYRDLEHAQTVWTTSDVATDLAEDFHDQFSSTQVLAWGPNSARTFSSNRPLESVEDFAGQRIRMPGNPIHLEIAELFGANPQVIPLGDLFTALETGVVDGQDNGMVTLIGEALYEVQDYVYETNHITAVLPFVTNDHFLEELSPDHREIVREGAADTAAAAWQNYLDGIEDEVEFLEENGVTVTQPTEEEREQMIDRLAPLYEDLYDEHEWAEDLVHEIEAVE